MAKQQTIPGTTKRAPAPIRKAATTYLERRRAHAEQTRELREAKTVLIGLMLDAGETRYEDDELVITLEQQHKVKVRDINDEDEDGDE